MSAMILPRAWAPKVPAYDYGLLWVNRSIAASKPDNLRFLGGLFWKQPTGKRRRNAYKNAATRMAQKFAARLEAR